MSINLTQLRDSIIIPTLKAMDIYSLSAVNLLLGTAAQESRLGTYVKQLGCGPAVGIYQVEPNTYYDITNQIELYKTPLKEKILEVCNFQRFPVAEELISNIKYATIITRLYYMRIKDPLPIHNDIEGMARYWKKYYNTVLGKGTSDEFIRSYKHYIGQ